jgi:predicted GTPase
MSERTRVVILGAGGRDFHTFNCLYRDDPKKEVVAFTAAQIPNIDHRTYPPILAGRQYPKGIPIVPERELEQVIAKFGVTECVFAYSDVKNTYVDKMRERVAAAGATLEPFPIEESMLVSTKPVIAVCAVRTGCGKSPVTRHVAEVLGEEGLRVAVIRHPMPYGDLQDQVVQRFASLEDLCWHRCTIEEREEYEPHVKAGNVVYAGADYERILRSAEEEADIIIWDGGNNDAPFVKPDLLITLVDPLRPGDELNYFPGRWNLENADVVVIPKAGEASGEALAAVRRSALRLAPQAPNVLGELAITVPQRVLIHRKRALVIEDGPTVTHGGMPFGAGLLGAEEAEAGEIVDPRPYATGQIAAAFEAFPHLTSVLPALGYGEDEITDLQLTINRIPCDVIVLGTPIDITRVLNVHQPVVRVSYAFREHGERLAAIIRRRFGATADTTTA